MLFHSLTFLFFFAIYFTIHSLIPRRFRLWLVILGGTIFYAWWNPWLMGLPHVLAVMAWIGGLWCAHKPMGERQFRCTVTIILLLAPLMIFKYADFLRVDFFSPLLGDQATQRWNLPLPLGISFITFTMIAYVVDVCRGRWPVEKRPHMIDAYMVFFPHLIAGPILRPYEIVPQLDAAKTVPWQKIRLYALIFIVGFIKKVLFADQFAGVVDHAYTNPAELIFFDAWLAVYGFALQIYCDFSGYTDMAIGLAGLLGIRLPNNFMRPYAATSIVDFWRRWHITLSRWLRDYLYIPLGGNRGSRIFQMRNLMITMILGGLWHGASWTFALWGALHGLFISLSHVLRAAGISLGHSKLAHVLHVVITFHIVALLWVLFRARDMGTANHIFTGLVQMPSGVGAFVSANAYYLLLLAAFLLLHLFDSHGVLRYLLKKIPAYILWPVTLLVAMLGILLTTESSGQFIYFDF